MFVKLRAKLNRICAKKIVRQNERKKRAWNEEIFAGGIWR